MRARRTAAVASVLAAVTAGCGAGGPDEEFRDAEPGHVEAFEAPPADLYADDEDGHVLRGADYELRVVDVQQARTLDEALAGSSVDTSTEFQAPEGHELLVATLAAPLDREAPRTAVSHRVTAADRAHERPGLPVQPGSGLDTLLVAVVPEGDGATLTVVEDGHPQSIDLRTGELGEDAIADLQETPHQDLTGTAYVQSGTVPWGPSAMAIPLHLELELAWRTPWDATLGWAPEGRRWLGLQLVNEQGDCGGQAACFPTPVLPHAMFSLVDAAGATTYPARDGALAEVPQLAEYVTFDVPADLGAATLRIDPATIAPVVPVDEGWEGVGWSTAPPPQDVPLELAG